MILSIDINLQKIVQTRSIRVIFEFQVSAIYMDPSLDSNMVLVIVRMILYAEKRDGMVSDGKFIFKSIYYLASPSYKKGNLTMLK